MSLRPRAARQHCLDRPGSRADMTPHPTSERHAWIVDSIEEDVATVEEDGARTLHVPRRLLPAAASEGSVLSVERAEDSGGTVQLRITIAASSTGSLGDDHPRSHGATESRGDIIL